MEELVTVNNKYLDGSQRRSNRTWRTQTVKDFDELISSFDYREIVSQSRRLYANHGIVKGAIQQKSIS